MGYFQQGYRSFVAAETLLPGRAVKIVGDNRVGYAAIGDDMIGVTTECVAAGCAVAVKLLCSVGTLDASLAGVTQGGQSVGLVNSQGQFGPAVGEKQRLFAIHAGAAGGYTELAVCRTIQEAEMAMLPGEESARAAMNFGNDVPIEQALLVNNTAEDWTDARTLNDYTAAVYGRAQRPGRVGNSPCVTFDGVDDHIAFTAAPSGVSGSNTLSIMAWLWVNTGFTSGVGQILTTSDFRLEVRINSGLLELIFTQSGVGTKSWYYTTQYPKGQWTHLGITFSSGTAAAYINGSAITLTPIDTAAVTTIDWNATWRIGYRTSNIYPLAGRLGGLWVYNRALSAGEILGHANQSQWADTSGLQLVLPFCEQSGTKIHDASGVSNLIGTANTAAIWNASNKQDKYHHCLRYGASVYKHSTTPDDTATPRILIPHNLSQAAITHATPSGYTADKVVNGGKIPIGAYTTIDRKNGTTAGWMDDLALETNLNYFSSVTLSPKSWNFSTAGERDQLFAFEFQPSYIDQRGFEDRPEPTWSNILVNGGVNPWTAASFSAYLASGDHAYDRDWSLLVIDVAQIAIAKALCIAKNLPLIMNLEAVPWGLHFDSTPAPETGLTRDDAIEKMVEWMQATRETFPTTVPIGLYSEVPERSWWFPINYYGTILLPSDPWFSSHAAEFTADYNDWLDRNMDLTPISEQMDIICPSLYIPYKIDNPNNDYGPVYTRALQRQKYVEYNLAQSAIYGLPIMPFLHPRITGEQVSAPYDIVIPPAENVTFLNYILADSVKVRGILNWDYYGYPGGWAAVEDSFEAIRLALR